MKIKYYLIDNTLAEDPNECRAQVSSYETVTEEEIFDYITRKGSGITMGEIQANYTEIIEAHEFFMKQGYGINTEFIKARPSIVGIFTDKNDTFEPSRHRVRFNAQFGKRYNQTAASVSTEKIEQISKDPVVAEFEDLTSGTVNEHFTSGGAAIITGLRLRFDQNDAKQGIFFVLNGTATKVSRIMDMRSTKLVFMIPAGLATGDYNLEVRKVLNGSKEILKGVLSVKLES